MVMNLLLWILYVNYKQYSVFLYSDIKMFCSEYNSCILIITSDVYMYYMY